jgi:hypothetical protein
MSDRRLVTDATHASQVQLVDPHGTHRDPQVGADGIWPLGNFARQGPWNPLMTALESLTGLLGGTLHGGLLLTPRAESCDTASALCAVRRLC